MRMRVALVAFVGLSTVACGGGDDASPTAADGPIATGSDDATPTPPVTLGAVPDIGAAPGTAFVFLPDESGILTQLRLDVDTCVIDPDAQADGEVPAELLAASASGTTEGGTGVDVDVRRFRSVGASPTITDTVTIVFGDPDAPDRALVAQRFEVDGLVSDLRDPAADDPLLVVGPSGFEGRGLFGPPGGGIDAPELVEGAVRVACP